VASRAVRRLPAPDGSPAYPDFDTGPLENDPGTVLTRLPPRPVILPEDTAGLDALVLLAEEFPRVVHRAGRPALVVARFGVGFDQVDTAACTEAGVAVSITPGAVRRAVAVAIVTLMLALTGRLLEKDRLTRLGPAGFARRGEVHGDRAGGAGARLPGPRQHRRRDVPPGGALRDADGGARPYADPALAASLGVESVGAEELFRAADVLAVNCPLNDGTRGFVSAGGSR
jgi:D-3-phosphoglycerate dehydrogenase